MNLSVLFILLLVVTFGMSAWLPRYWSALAWLVPLGIAAFYFVGWVREGPDSENAESERGLFAFVGITAVVLTAAAAALGRRFRR